MLLFTGCDRVDAMNYKPVQVEDEPLTVTITEEEYRDLCWSSDTLSWLQNQGLCWRGVDSAFPDWRVGNETEWHYSNSGDVRETVDAHRSILSDLPNNTVTSTNPTTNE